MKKTFLLAAMSLFLFVGLTAMVSTTPPPENTTCHAQCDVLVAAGVFATNGACMSACNTCLNPSSSAGSSAVCQCKVIDALIGLENTPWRNMGACVKYWKAVFS